MAEITPGLEYVATLPEDAGEIIYMTTFRGILVVATENGSYAVGNPRKVNQFVKKIKPYQESLGK